MMGNAKANFVKAVHRNECCHREFLKKISIAIQEEDVESWPHGLDHPGETDWQEVEELEVPRRIANLSGSIPALSQEIYQCRNCKNIYEPSEAKNLPRYEQDQDY